MTTANERQVDGTHYKKQSKSGKEHWDIVEDFGLDYFQGQITKYVMRFRLKNGIKDLEKARHFLDKLIEIEKQKELDVQAAKVGDRPANRMPMP